jgi:LmbE family N-acetylglucosaminyl deacetylase
MRSRIARSLFTGLRRRFAGHDRVFKFLHSLSLQEQAASLLLPGPERVLVIAPHMDDEILGCGGAIALHADAGATLCIVYLTDGRYGAAPGNAGQPDLARRRRTEAESASRLVGAQDLQFIDGQGNRLEQDAPAAQRLRDQLRAFRPDVVYLPSALERHPDHRATGDVLAAAVSGGGFDFECRAYEVWTPLAPNRVVDIDRAVERKRAALRCYGSQLEHTDFLHAVIALNGYRSSLVPGGRCRYAEAFHAAPLAAWLGLHRQLRGGLNP